MIDFYIGSRDFLLLHPVYLKDCADMFVHIPQ